MHSRNIRSAILFLLAGMVLAGAPARAEDAASRAGSAVADVLFRYDGDEFVSYRLRADGFAELEFARNTPDPLYRDILDALRAHPEIPGVLAGKGGPACARF